MSVADHITTIREALHDGLEYHGHELDDVTGLVHAISPQAKLYERGMVAADAVERELADLRAENEQYKAEIIGCADGVSALVDRCEDAERRLREATDTNTAATPGERITHGRHCTCTPCARQDWSEPHLAPCGMHGPSCPNEYQPWGQAGTYRVVAADPRETTT